MPQVFEDDLENGCSITQLVQHTTKLRDEWSFQGIYHIYKTSSELKDAFVGVKSS